MRLVFDDHDGHEFESRALVAPSSAMRSAVNCLTYAGKCARVWRVCEVGVRDELGREMRELHAQAIARIALTEQAPS